MQDGRRERALSIEVTNATDPNAKIRETRVSSRKDMPVAVNLRSRWGDARLQLPADRLVLDLASEKAEDIIDQFKVVTGTVRLPSVAPYTGKPVTCVYGGSICEFQYRQCDPRGGVGAAKKTVTVNEALFPGETARVTETFSCLGDESHTTTFSCDANGELTRTSPTERD